MRPDSGSIELDEEELLSECADLERQLQQDPLSRQNETLQVQLVQMQDDFLSLQEEFRSMHDYYRDRLAAMTSQLEDQNRAAASAEGHVECLRRLLRLHEEQGRFTGSYWQAQCEKRDDSIRFLTLKLNEYTVPSEEYEVLKQSSDAKEDTVVLTLHAKRQGEDILIDCRSSQGAQACVLRLPATETVGVLRSMIAEEAAHLLGEGGEQRLTLALQDGTIFDDDEAARQHSLEEQLLQATFPRHGVAMTRLLQNARSSGSRSPRKEKDRKGLLAARQDRFKILCEEHKSAMELSQAQALESKRLRKELQEAELERSSLRAEAELRRSEEDGASSSSLGAFWPFGRSASKAEVEEEGDAEEMQAVEEELKNLEAEVAAWKEKLEASQCCNTSTAATADKYALVPHWARTCPWRADLDVRAGQLERISQQLDGTKRMLDSASEDLQWQATSAEALRMRLGDVLRAIKTEQLKTEQLRSEHQAGEASLEELLQQVKLWLQEDCEEDPALLKACQAAERVLEAEWARL
mmetsp:Transcript_72480/g.172786  ORF Transcript_72480/g.172786 Transcript_72480/m.172786 type:complete len:524 (-) Transcript_72480:23-1594(-)